MKQRLLVAALGVPALLAVLLACPPWATLLLVCAIAGIAAYELLHTAEKDAPLSFYVLTVLTALLTEVTVFLGSERVRYTVWWAFLMLLFAVAVRRFGKENAVPFSAVAVSTVGGIVFPMLYTGVFLLRMEGRAYALFPFVVAFIGDTFSMLAGMWFGKKSRKLAPFVSPKKTWVGGIAGPIGSALGLAALGFVGGRFWGYEPNYLRLLAAGVLANIFGQLGDLSMSLIKREAGIKDYSRLFLTHGGVLDRFDSTMFIAPVLYFFVSGGLL